jgi:hypothetical protein
MEPCSEFRLLPFLLEDPDEDDLLAGKVPILELRLAATFEFDADKLTNDDELTSILSSDVAVSR